MGLLKPHVFYKIVMTKINLEWLHLSDNLLTSLPAEVKEWKKIKFICFFNNKISKIEKEKIQAWLPKTVIYFD